MERYSVIRDKNPREIVLLRGRGCQWRQCTFCDYHLDFSADDASNYSLNREVLSCVTGCYNRLEVINSGSVVDLDPDTMAEIRLTAESKGIRYLHFECHWMHRDRLNDIREFFAQSGVEVIFKIGIETFDVELRERVLKKGLGNPLPQDNADAGFSEINLLCCIAGQTSDSMRQDIETGLRFFSRVCVNVMTPNTTCIRPDPELIRIFGHNILPLYRDNPRVDILMENTDFGVG